MKMHTSNIVCLGDELSEKSEIGTAATRYSVERAEQSNGCTPVATTHGTTAASQTSAGAAAAGNAPLCEGIERETMRAAHACECRSSDASSSCV